MIHADRTSVGHKANQTITYLCFYIIQKSSKKVICFNDFLSLFYNFITYKIIIIV